MLFFQVLFSLVLTVYEGHIRTVCCGNVILLLSESLRSTLFFCKVENLFSIIFFWSEASNGFTVKPMFLEGHSFLHFWCNVDTSNLCPRIRSPRLSLTMSQPAEAVWKQQLQRFVLLGWVFQRCYSLDSYIFFVRFQFLSPGNEVSFCWWFVVSQYSSNSFAISKNGTLCELVCEHLFFLFEQNSCFSLSSIAIEKFFSSTRITCASVSDVRSMNSFADTPCTFPKHLLAFISPNYRSRISKEGWIFLFILKKIFLLKKQLLQNRSSTLLNGW